MTPQPPPAQPSLWQIHRGHLLLLAVWVVVVAVVYATVKIRERRDQRPTGDAVERGPLVLLVAAASVASGAVHVAVIREHFTESALYGWFFLVLAALQFAWSAWLVARPSAALLTSGGAASFGVALLWLATRTVGIPLGPAAGEREPFGGLDIAASAAELLVAVGVAVLLISRARVHRAPYVVAV